MVGLGRKGQMELRYPFCNRGKVTVFHKEGYIQAKKSHITAGDKTTFYQKPDTYEVLQNCPNFGRNAKGIQRAYETGVTETLAHKERLERFKKAGFPTRIVQAII